MKLYDAIQLLRSDIDDENNELNIFFNDYQLATFIVRGIQEVNRELEFAHKYQFIVLEQYKDVYDLNSDYIRYCGIYDVKNQTFVDINKYSPFLSVDNRNILESLIRRIKIDENRRKIYITVPDSSNINPAIVTEKHLDDIIKTIIIYDQSGNFSGYSSPAWAIMNDNGIYKALKVVNEESNVPDISTHTQTFDNPLDFIYDANKTEISNGKLIQKDARPANATFYAKLNKSISADWGGGTLSPITSIGATISSERLAFDGSTVGARVEYNTSGNCDFKTTGTIRFRVTPNYSGGTSEYQVFYSVLTTNGSGNNLISIFHYGTSLTASLRDNVGTIHNMSTSFSPIAGQEYEIELDFDFVTGAQYLFVDGILRASNTVIMTRNDVTFMRIGNLINNAAKPNFKIRDILLFSTVQHTSDYTPDWSNISEYSYRADVITVATDSYTKTIKSLANFTENSTGTEVRYTINGYYYHNGSWILSNDTYEQANNISIINANIGKLSFTSNDINIKIFTTDNNDRTELNSFGYDVIFTGNKRLTISEIITLSNKDNHITLDDQYLRYVDLIIDYIYNPTIDEFVYKAVSKGTVTAGSATITLTSGEVGDSGNNIEIGDYVVIKGLGSRKVVNIGTNTFDVESAYNTYLPSSPTAYDLYIVKAQKELPIINTVQEVVLQYAKYFAYQRAAIPNAASELGLAKQLIAEARENILKSVIADVTNDIIKDKFGVWYG